MTEDQLKSIVEYIQSKGIDAVCRSSGVISFYLFIEGKKYEAECVLGYGFPYELPEIYATDELFEIIKKIPHVSYWKNICTFDKETMLPNFESPEDLVYECIKKAINVINNGITEKNEADYIDESLAYWGNQKNLNHMLMIGRTDEYVDDFWYSEDTIAPRKDLLNDSCKHGIILHTSFIFKGNYNFFNFLQKALNESNRDKLSLYIGGNIASSHIFLVKNTIDRRSVFYCLKTPTFIDNINGFRRGKANILIACSFNKSKEFEPIILDNATQDYLYTRGGTGLKIEKTSATIVGCGSFGSYLSEFLMEYGFDKFTFIDNDCITTDNIARHLCGHSWLNKKKAIAVGANLKNHNPNISFSSYSNDVHEIINEKLSILNSNDYIFLCVGHLGTEKRVFDLAHNGSITKPIIIIWAEPYCVACHAVIINNQAECFSLLYDSNLHFTNNVILNSDSFYKRESGCRSTYIPYSSYMIKHFLLDFLYWFLETDRCQLDNYLFTWIGDLKIADRIGAKVSDEFSTCNSFTSIIRKIS